jgi:TolB protein
VPAFPRSRKVGLALAAAVLASLVLVLTLTGEGPLSSGSDDTSSGSDDTSSGSDDTAGKRTSPNRRAPSARPLEEPRRGSGSPVTAPGGGGDEGEQEWSVYVVAARGGHPVLMARTPSEVPVTPAWSSRRGLIAFVRPGCDDCDAAVWLSRADGSGRRKLSARLGNQTDPAWSPNGDALAAVRVGAGLHALSARDGASRPLLGRAVVEDPAWSPRGGAIAFARRQGAANWDLYVIGPRGHGLRRLTRTGRQELAPDWSPDGRRIVFQRQDPTGAWSVYAMRADGSGVRRLIAGTNAHSIVQPAWSPDGRSIAFVGVTLTTARIEIVRLGAGRAPERITGAALQASDPDWSPDGRRVVFSAKQAKD